MHRSRPAALAAGFLLAAAPLAAQSPDSLRITGEIGVVNAAGNTDLTTVNIGDQIRWRRGRLGLGQKLAVVYGRSDGQTTSSQWRAGLRADYPLSAVVSAYGAAGYDRDRFAGIARRFEEGTGLAIAILRRERDRLESEAGVSLVQQRSTVGTRDNFASARAAAMYEHHFTDQTYLRQALETTTNLEDGSDFRINSESALVAPLSRRLAVKISYVIRYDHQPEPGFGTTDRLLTSGLQFTL